MARVKMRLTGTDSDLEPFLLLLKKMEDRQMVSIIETSKSYPNRGDSKQCRVYLEIDFLLPI